LLEIVTDPDLASAEEVEEYIRALREILVFSGVSDMRFEEGAGRFDVNVSIRFTDGGKTVWPPQSEIKNLNSYEAMRSAVAYEADRLWQEWQAGGELRTRKGKITVGWSPERRRTYLQRSKEEVEDYRYFPEPDLVALAPAAATVAELRKALPEMPTERRARFVASYGITDKDARILVNDRALADYYEAAVTAEPGQPKAIANWVVGDLAAALKRESARIAASRVSADQLAALVRLLAAGRITGTAAKQVFAEMWKNGGDPEAIVNTLGLAQVSDEAAIAAAVDEVIKAQPKAVADYKRGKQIALDGLIGAVMGRMKGKANGAVVRRLILERIT
jgi:aspartyl-tRNA(Asn)/glutamyl-tRNA(Gln) amidotransferase subunit B